LDPTSKTAPTVTDTRQGWQKAKAWVFGGEPRELISE
jgi:hypothetical protein